MPITKASGQAVAPAAKGDLVVGSATNDAAVLAVGSNDQVLTADSSTTTGLKWAAASGGMTLLSTTSLSGATTTISSISQDYKQLLFFGYGMSNATADGFYRLAPNGSTTIVLAGGLVANAATGPASGGYGQLLGNAANSISRTGTNNSFICTIANYTSTTAVKPITIFGVSDDSDTYNVLGGMINTTSAITSLVFSNSGGNLSTGTVLLYGVK